MSGGYLALKQSKLIGVQTPVNLHETLKIGVYPQLILEVIMKTKFILTLILTVLASACGNDNEPVETTLEQSKPVQETTADMQTVAYEITSQALHERIKTISSDYLEGRKPATSGGKKTVDLLVSEFEKIGLQAALDNSYKQKVPLVEIIANPATSLNISRDDDSNSYAYKDEMVVWTKRVSESISLKDSEVVFVGYGIVAPEYGWNDYEGIDVTGKTVLILVNDPGYATQDPEMFKGNSMTYYGRWTYKYEEAARQGAAMALVIHETAPAAYPWSVVESSWVGSQFDLVAEDKNMSRSAVEGWISQKTTGSIMKQAGYDYSEIKAMALKENFQAFSLHSKASIEFDNTLKESTSYNVIGILPGAQRPDEYLVYMAHWDHFGTNPSIESDDKIYNGALDNASGVAALLELAKAFTQKPTAPDRSIVFLAVTAEEYGLHGSRYYAENPVYPLQNTVAGINIDGLNIIGRTNDIAVVGQGMSELEQYLVEETAKQNRIVVAEAFPEKGYYYRSDHFNLAKYGVPMLYTDGGVDSVEHGSEWGLNKSREYVEQHYHQPSDEYDPDWDLSGALEDVQLYFEIGQRIANGSEWPEWNEKSEFKAIRDKSRAN